MAHEQAASCTPLVDQRWMCLMSRAEWQPWDHACSTQGSEQSCQGGGSSAADQPCSLTPWCAVLAPALWKMALAEPNDCTECLLQWAVSSPDHLVWASAWMSLDVNCRVPTVFHNPYALMTIICHTSDFVLLAYSTETSCKAQMDILIKKIKSALLCMDTFRSNLRGFESCRSLWGYSLFQRDHCYLWQDICYLSSPARHWTIGLFFGRPP